MGTKAGPLKRHPNFRVPKHPKGRTTEEVVRFVLDFCASLVSPPQVEGEDEDRPCTEVAKELRDSFADVMLALGGKIPEKQEDISPPQIGG